MDQSNPPPVTHEMQNIYVILAMDQSNPPP